MAGITLIAEPGGKDVIAYRPPAHARNAFGLYFKHRSFPRGTVPAHLVSYLGQAKGAPVACAGKKGQEYRGCMIVQTAPLRKGATAPKKKK
jgi:hypothetical protein